VHKEANKTMSAEIEIHQEKIWVTPAGYQHAEYLECVMCHDIVVDKRQCDHPCPNNYQTDFPKWNTPWRPTEMDLTQGHYYHTRMVTKDINEIPKNIMIHWVKPIEKKVQMRLF
jgi:hypothetical protein